MTVPKTRRITENIKSGLLVTMIVIGLHVHAYRAHAEGYESIIVAGGCFWCVEKDFESVAGVIEATSGFTGGETANPTYRQVGKGTTGHLEAVRVEYDPKRISARRLYDLFFRSIDPTDAGGQFCDRGESYTTAVFVKNAAQRTEAEAAKAAAQSELGRTIVTPIRSAGEFYPAEAYHQNYYKGTKRVITRFGIKSQAEAYKAYRKACGRDERLKELWGDGVPLIIY
ncbi:MAG: peptide-methionine (S)-S-oxide reductase MsrA [Pseudomonadota bacterium]